MKELGYPASLAKTFVFRRKVAENVTHVLFRMMQQGHRLENAIRLPSDRDYFLLPINKRIEIIGSAADLPQFVSDMGDEVMVRCVSNPVLFCWKEGEGLRWFLIPPGPKPLREEAEQEVDEVQKNDLLRLAAWIEAIPLSPLVGPDVE
jgi:hypothetical protein